MAFTGADIASRLTITLGSILNSTSVTGSSYNVLTSDNVIMVNYAGAVSITLPATGGANQLLIIKDASGAAATNNITVVGTVDGVTNPVIGSNYGGVGLIYENGWFQIF
jgi:hypothetical protein